MKRDRFHDALSLLDEGILFLDSDGSVLMANDRAARIFAVEDRESLVGHPIPALGGGQDKGWFKLRKAIVQAKSDTRTVQDQSGNTILAVFRGGAREGGPGALVLIDLELFDYHRRKASGKDSAAPFQILGDQRARPDFTQQRTLSEALNLTLEIGEKALSNGADLLITGEAGTGKTEVAQYFHDFIADRSDPFIVVNCAAIPAGMFDEVLFGAAPTGSDEPRIGALEAAEGGTLFLDSVDELPLTIQSKLLQFIETGTSWPARATTGARKFRILSASNRNLQHLVSQGEFRANLYYRLAVVVVPLPALREMARLTNYLIDRFVRLLNLRRAAPIRVAQGVRQRLLRYRFSGNIRELMNVVQQLSLIADDPASQLDALERILDHSNTDPQAVFTPSEGNLKSQVRSFENAIIQEAIERHGSMRKAADALGVNIGTISRKAAVSLSDTNQTDQTIIRLKGD